MIWGVTLCMTGVRRVYTISHPLLGILPGSCTNAHIMMLVCFGDHGTLQIVPCRGCSRNSVTWCTQPIQAHSSHSSHNGLTECLSPSSPYLSHSSLLLLLPLPFPPPSPPSPSSHSLLYLSPELSFLETSALTGENVEEVFLKCTRSILSKIDAGEWSDYNHVGIALCHPVA